MTVLLIAHAVLAILAPVLARPLGQRVFWLSALVPAGSAAWLVGIGPTILAGGTYVARWSWIDALDLRLDLRIGLLQWILGLVVTVIGALVMVYCRWYFAGDPPQARVAGLLLGFAGAMLGLVSADNLLGLYVFWELTTVFSYLLVGHNPLRAANRGAAMTALLVTTFGGLGMLAGFLLLADLTGTSSLAAIVASPPSGPGAVTATLLIILGALTKSAQVPFHFWLPGAMAAPTPVSAYLHSASMVKAGIYLVAVLSPGLAGVPGWRPVLLAVGAITMVLGGYRALRQTDIKLLLAYGTVSQLGFLIVLFGAGTRAAAFAGLALLVSHAVFKSALFLVVGIVDHRAHTRDLRELSRVGRQMPQVAAAATVAGLSMAGLPPTAGFLAKESAFEAAIAWLGPAGGETGMLPGPAWALVIMLVLGSVLTVAYTLRFLWGAFAGKREVPKPTPVDEVGPGFAFAPTLLGVACLVLAFVGPQWTTVIAPFAATLPVGEEPHGLALWHGFTVPLALSAVCWLGGGLLFVFRERVTALQETMPYVMSANEVYFRVLRGLDQLAVEVTARLQPGSLPLYLGAILGVFVLSAGTAVFVQPGLGGGVRLWDTPAQAVIGVLICAAAWLAAGSRGRLKAVILVGVTGYGVALLFLLHGAPDLALTQVLTETVSVVVFVLVLRKLPKYFTDRPLTSTRWWRIVLAVLVAATVVGTVLVTATARRATPISVLLRDASWQFGYGRNIVNVTLVDTRAWDTLGEITVLLVAATGVASLIFIRARYGRRSPAEARNDARRAQDTEMAQAPSSPDAPAAPTWLRGGLTLSPLRRSLVMEVITRLLFPIMVLTSVQVLMAGHNAPGGGFAGGLIAGLALVVRYLAGGRHELDEAAPVEAGVVLGSGLVVSVLAAVAPLLFGGTILQSYDLDIHLPGLAGLDIAGWHLPLLGEFHLVTSVFFDIGVYLVVIGLMLDVARSLGSGIDVQAEQDRAPQPILGGGVRGGRSAIRMPGRPVAKPRESDI